MTGPIPAKTVGLSTPQFAADLLTDLYVRLRRDLLRWAAVTHQTPQPRMGYVGQHLVSVVTGHPGGRSGARGDDIKLPGGKVAEIKCCYRVDQLGQCLTCGAGVASIERRCPNADCGGVDLERKDDSKWLLTPKSEAELRELFTPLCYYLVLFEFADIALADDIDVRIFEVDPRSLGFTLCMIDYYFNIRAKSDSAAPFNLWPDSPKFYMMKPREIYWAVIRANDTIDTKNFPGRDAPVAVPLKRLDEFAASATFCEAAIDAVATARSVKFPAKGLPAALGKRRRAKLELLEAQRIAQGWADDSLADDFARAVFRGKTAGHPAWVKEFSPTL